MKELLIKRPCLYIPRHGGQASDQWYLMEGVTLIGKIFEANIKLDTLELSDRHALLFEREGQVFLTDMGAARGIYVNGLRLSSNSTVMLEDTDNILLAGVNLRFFFKTVQELQQAKLLNSSPNITLQKAPITLEEEIRAIKERTSSDEPPPIPVELLLGGTSIEKEVVLPPSMIPNMMTFTTKHEESSASIELQEIREFEYKNEVDKSNYINKRKAATLTFAIFSPPVEGVPAPMRRFVAFLLDLFLAWFLFASFQGHVAIQAVAKISETFLREVYPIDKGIFLLLDANLGEGMGRPLIIGVIVFFLFLLVYRFVCHLIFGVSLGAACFGLSGGDTFVWNRIGGAIRAFIGWFTLPLFLIIDLPIFFGRRTLREGLSLTRVIQKESRVRPFLALFLIPLFLIGVLIWPFYLQRDLKDGVTVKKYEDNDLLVNSEVPEIPLSKEVESSYYHFGFKYYDYSKDVKLKLIPSFDVIKKGVFKKILPVLIIYDDKHQVAGEFRAEYFSKLAKILFETSKVFWGLRTNYPELALYLSALKESDFNNKDFKFPPLSHMVVNDIELLMTRSLELKTKDLLSYIREGTPFVYGYAFLRSKILTELVEWSTSGDLDVAFLTWGNHLFLTLTKKSGLEDRSGRLQRFFIPIKSLNGIVYELSFESSHRAQKTERRFLRTINADLKWTFDADSNKSTPLPGNEMTPEEFFSKLNIFHLIDRFGEQDAKGDERKVLEEFLYSYYLDLGHQALKEKEPDAKFLQLLTDLLERPQMVSTTLESTIGDRSIFVQSLKELQRAIVDRKLDFFEPTAIPVAPLDINTNVDADVNASTNINGSPAQ